MQRTGGVSRFTTGLLSSLAKQQGLDLMLHLPETLMSEPLHYEGVRICQDVAFRPWRLSVKYNNMALRWRCWWRGVKVYHAPYYETNAPRNTGVVVTVHDMIHESFPQLLLDPETIQIKKDAIMRADLLVAVSAQTRDDLVSILKIPPERIVVVYHGLDPAFADVPNADATWISEHTRRNVPYWLHVGCRRSYKNFDCLVKAFSRVAGKTDADLLLIGGEQNLEDAERSMLSKAGCLDRVHLLGNVSDAQMRAAYAQAVGIRVVFPRGRFRDSGSGGHGVRHPGDRV